MCTSVNGCFHPLPSIHQGTPVNSTAFCVLVQIAREYFRGLPSDSNRHGDGDKSIHFHWQVNTCTHPCPFTFSHTPRNMFGVECVHNTSCSKQSPKTLHRYGAWLHITSGPLVMANSIPSERTYGQYYAHIVLHERYTYNF